MKSTYHIKTTLAHFSVSLFTLCLSSSCQYIKSKEEKANKPDSIIRTSVTKATKTDLDTLITTPCALLIYPTLKQIEDMKKNSADTDEFYTAADDNQYYMAMSIRFLDSVKTKTITKYAEGDVRFKTNAGQIFKIPLRELQWNVVLFNGYDKPKTADITMIEEDYRSYMRR